MKISDNNIENIFNININIQGVFSNSIEQDIISVVVGLLNQQGGLADGGTLKEQLMELAKKSEQKDLDINIPASSLGKQFSFDGLASKIHEAIAKKPADAESKSESSGSGVEAQAKDLFQKYLAQQSSA